MKEDHETQVCVLCQGTKPANAGKIRNGTRFAAGFPRPQFYCNACLKRGRIFLFALAVVAVLTAAVIRWTV